MFKNALPALAMMTFGLAACGDSNSLVDTTPMNGHWVAPAFGIALTVEPTGFRYYQYTEQTCQIFNKLFDESLAQFVGDVELAQDEQALMNPFFGAKMPAIEFKREVSLPESCVSSLVANFDEDGYVRNPVRDFDIFWQNFYDHYSYFELNKVDWKQQRDTWRPEVSADTSDLALLDIFAQMIEPLADGHVVVASADRDLDFSFRNKPNFFDIIDTEHEKLPEDNDIDLEDYFHEQIELVLEIISSSVEEGASVTDHDSEMALWSVLPNNIGYVNLFGMERFTDSGFVVEQLETIDIMFDDIFNDLAEVDSMIIDLRFNMGGFDRISAQIAGRFTDVKTLGWSKQTRLEDARLPLENVFIEPTARSNFLKPVVLLTSATTASAAEVFALAMKQRVAGAQLVGESTQGMFSDVLPKSLPNGTNFTMSTDYYFSADGEFYETLGIPVDVEAAFFTIQDRKNLNDPGLTAAQNLLNNK